jgi:hypothetical protein
MEEEQYGIPSHLLGYRFHAASARQSPQMKPGAQLGAAQS